MDTTAKFLLSFGMILFFGFIVGFLFTKIKLPKIIGMIIVGILLGPSVLNILDESLLNISSILRQIALVIILTRAGLSLDLKTLKQIGRPAILMCFIPASLELCATTIFAPLLLGISVVEALLLGSVLAAVSPAVVVPMMLKLKDEGYGSDKHVPDLILAGASCDDIYVIVLFYSFLGLVKNDNMELIKLIQIPTSIILGIAIGVLVGFILGIILSKVKLNNVIKLIITISISFGLLAAESALKGLLSGYLSISALLSIMVYSMVLRLKNKEEAIDVKKPYDGLWIVFEIILFTLVGAKLDITLIPKCGLQALGLILIILVFRSIGVYLCMIKTNLNNKERLFAIISYLPKATVQASIGGIALDQGLSCGAIILAISVLAIVITAPLGAIGMNLTYKKLLKSYNEVETIV